MRTIKQTMHILFIGIVATLMFSGCEKFLDRKPLEATLVL